MMFILTFVWTFIKNISPTYWVMIALVLALGGMYATNKVLSMSNEKLRSVIVAKDSSLALKDTIIKNMVDEKKQLTMVIDKQNASVLDLGNKKKNIEAKLVKVDTVNKQQATEIEKLLERIKQEPAVKDCPGALIEIKSFTGEFAKKWNTK